jgi:TRAP-type C4-dicarboxylate transport system substrate-binding protein
MNRDVYESLPEPVHALLAQSGQFIADAQIESYGAAIEANIAGWEADAAHTVVTPSAEDEAEIARRVQPVIDRVAAAATPGLIEAYRAKLEEIRSR